nr:MAG TPA: SRR1 [Caudoviricetes sp.]
MGDYATIRFLLSASSGVVCSDPDTYLKGGGIVCSLCGGITPRCAFSVMLHQLIGLALLGREIYNPLFTTTERALLGRSFTG